MICFVDIWRFNKTQTMKILKIILIAICIPTFGISQSTVNTMEHGGLTRSYRLYIPSSYTGTVAVPLLFNLHGYTSNASQQEFYGDFRGIADTANFILVHPDGTLDGSGARFWNAFGAAGGVDDVGFISALIDKIDEDYNIDLNRVYSCGMSNGGFMSYRLACELGNRITAIASVTGTMPTNSLSTCNPYKPTPIMQIHGTADPTVPYNGNTAMAAIETVVNWWVNFNQCTTPPTITNVPNTNTADMCTAENFLYTNGSNGSTVEFYKITSGGHTWPGAPITVGVTNQDFNASVEIWRFFSQYNTSGLLSISSHNSESDFVIYPNPVSDVLVISSELSIDLVTITDLSGRTIFTQMGHPAIISVSNLSTGVYFVHVFSGGKRLTKKISVQ
jgi:polyhydroxybutyrate depolymerase